MLLTSEQIIELYINQNKSLRAICREFHCDNNRIKRILKESGFNIKSNKEYFDITGKKFNMLTVIKRDSIRNNSVMYLCNCECGNTRIVKAEHLRSGRVKDCGCVSQKIRAMHISQHVRTHGGSKTRLYTCWSDMKSRCYRQKDKNFCNYGARGIKVCDEWLHSFVNFRDWALSNGYTNELTIDRINVNGNYCPENCRWADIKTQSRNKRNTRFCYYGNIGKTAIEWQEISGLNQFLIYKFSAKHNWHFEEYANKFGIFINELGEVINE